jgi:hypothetical protein
MDEFASKIRQEQNPVTAARHRKEVFWQITFPVGIFILVLLAMGLLASIPGTSVSVWANISLIWLIILMLIFTLILMFILAALAYLVIRINQTLPPYAFRAQCFFARLTGQVAHICDKAVEPALRSHALSASLRGLWRSVRRN